MSRPNSFIEDFKKDHSELLDLITSFRNTIESSRKAEAEDILNKIDDIANGHFTFEETYLYPRLRRLVLEITDNLRKEQQIVRQFIKDSKSLLDKDRWDKSKLTSLSDILPRVSKFFKDCNDLVFLVEKFGERDKDDLQRRFKERCGVKSAVSVPT